MTTFQKFQKRAFDIVVSFIVLIFLWWLILLTALIAWLDTGLNGFFKQERIGKKGIPFKVLKITTMRKVKGIESTVTTKNDPRVSPIGNFFRKVKLDELPQIINVLKGDMSLVGPRPTVKADFDRMTLRQRKRFEVPPGITGLAQINGNTALKWPERIEYDLKYVEEVSLSKDIEILFLTLKLVMTNKAETHPDGKNEWE